MRICCCGPSPRHGLQACPEKYSCQSRFPLAREGESVGSPLNIFPNPAPPTPMNAKSPPSADRQGAMSSVSSPACPEMLSPSLREPHFSPPYRTTVKKQVSSNSPSTLRTTIKAMLLLVSLLGPINCSSLVPSDQPQSRLDTCREARRDARAAIARGDYRFSGHSGGFAPSQAADGLPGLSKQIRDRVAMLSTETPDRSFRSPEEREQIGWQLKYGAMQHGRAKAQRGNNQGWDAPTQEIRLPAIGVVCAYFYTCMIEEPSHSRRVLYIEAYNREMASRMDERGKCMWGSVGVNIR
jgi:hypothetical protein